jgi:hypothetical protein
MQRVFNTVQELAAALPGDKELEDSIRNNPSEALKQAAGPIYLFDKWIYRIVVGALGFAIISTLIGAMILSGFGKPIPEGVIAIGSACAGALVGLLTPSPTSK